MVALPMNYSNPYVSYVDRDTDRNEMYRALREGDQAGFSRLAFRYNVRYAAFEEKEMAGVAPSLMALHARRIGTFGRIDLEGARRDGPSSCRNIAGGLPRRDGHPMMRSAPDDAALPGGPVAAVAVEQDPFAGSDLAGQLPADRAPAGALDGGQGGGDDANRAFNGCLSLTLAAAS